MNIQKSVAFAAALLITAAGMYGIVNITNATVGTQAAATHATTDVIRTLPTIHVHPTAEQLRELRSGDASVTPAHAAMPYYSFANDATGA